MTELTLFCESKFEKSELLESARQRSGGRTHVKVEEEGDEEAEREGDEYPLDGEVPERNNPIATVRRIV